MEQHTAIANNVTDPAGFNNPTAPVYSTPVFGFVDLIYLTEISLSTVVNGAAGHFQGLEKLLSPLPN